MNDFKIVEYFKQLKFNKLGEFKKVNNAYIDKKQF